MDDNNSNQYENSYEFNTNHLLPQEQEDTNQNNEQSYQALPPRFENQNMSLMLDLVSSNNEYYETTNVQFNQQNLIDSSQTVFDNSSYIHHENQSPYSNNDRNTLNSHQHLVISNLAKPLSVNNNDLIHDFSSEQNQVQHYIDPASAAYSSSFLEQLPTHVANPMLPFGHSQLPVFPAENFSQQHFQPLPLHSMNLQSATLSQRKEQDVFDELVSLATKNNNLLDTNKASGSNPREQQHWDQINQHYQHFVPPPSFARNNNSDNIHYQMLLEHQKQIKQGTVASQIQHLQNEASNFYASPSNTLIEGNNVKKETASMTTHNDRIYNLIFAQQPNRARMCGLGDKDRRPVSPPPILQLIIKTNHGQIIDPETFDVSFLIVMCESVQQADYEHGEKAKDKRYSEANKHSQVVSFPTSITIIDENGQKNNATIKMGNLVGSSVSSAIKLYDIEGKLGIFFVFQDISLRTEGCFRLKFSLVDIGLPYSSTINTTSASHILETIETDTFRVYTAKKYPGVVQSTTLSKHFASQGIKLPIRKEKDDARTSRKQKQDKSSEEQFQNEQDET